MESEKYIGLENTYEPTYDIKEVNTPFSTCNDNLIIFVTVNKLSSDKGAQELLKNKNLPPLDNLTLGSNSSNTLFVHGPTYNCSDCKRPYVKIGEKILTV